MTTGKISLEADVKPVESLTTALDVMGKALVSAVSTIADLEKAVVKQNDALEKARDKTTKLTDAQIAQQREAKNLAEAERALAGVREIGFNTQTAMLLKLQESINTYGMTSVALMRYKADLIGVGAAAEPLIAQLEILSAATKQYGNAITDVSSIELARLAEEESAITVFNAFKIRSMTENAAALAAQRDTTMAENATALAAQKAQEIAAAQVQYDAEVRAMMVFQAFKIRTMAENRAAAVKDIEEMEVIRIAALEKQQQDETAFAAFKIRTMAENRAAAIEIINAQENAAVMLAEKQAIEEIKWNGMSVTARIAQLEQLHAYQSASAITPETVGKTFSSAAIADLPNLARYQKEYAEALTLSSRGHKEAEGTAKSFGEALEGVRLNSSLARTELIVIGHEAMQGRFSKIPASMLVFAEYTDLAAVATTGIGVAIIGASLAAAGMAYEMIKGAAEVNSFNNAMVLTGNYAGTSLIAIDKMAEGLRSNAHNAIGTTTDMLVTLAKSGKFTNESLESTAKAALLMQNLTGESTEQTAKHFESLVKVHGKIFGDMVNHTADGVAAMNEQFGYLSASQYEHIRLLAAQGNQQQALLENNEALSKAFGNHNEKVGILIRSYRLFVEMMQDLIHFSKELGKDWFTPKSNDVNASEEAAKYETLMKQALAARNGTRLPNGLMGAGPDQAKYEQLLAQAKTHQQKMVSLQKQSNTEMQDAQNLADQTKDNKEAVEAQRSYDQTTHKNRSRKEQGEDEINRLKDNAESINRTAKASWERQYAGAKENMDKDMQLAIKNGQLQIISEEKLASDIQSVRDKHKGSKTAGAGGDGRKQELNDALATEDAKYKLVEEATKSNDDLLKAARKEGTLDKETERALEAQGQKDELSALAETTARKIAILRSYTAYNKNDSAETIRRINDVKRAEEAKAATITDRGNKTIAQASVDDATELAKVVEKIRKDGETDNKSLEQKIAKQKLYNAEIGKTKEEKELARKIENESYTLDLEREQLAIDAYLRTDASNNVEKQAYQSRLAELNQIIEKRRTLAGLQQAGADAEAADEYAKLWRDFATKAGNDLATQLIDGGGKGLKKLIHDFEASFARLILKPIIDPIQKAIGDVVGGTASSLLSAGSSVGSNVGLLSKGYGFLTGASAAGVVDTAGAATGAAIFSDAGFAASAEGVSLGLTGAAEAAATTTAATTTFGTALSSVTGALSAIGPLGWTALAGIAAFSLFGGGGETRYGGGYNTRAGGSVQLMGGPSGGEINGDQTRSAIQGAADGLQTLLKAFGSDKTVDFFTAGLESSKKGKAHTFAGGNVGGVGFGTSDPTAVQLGSASPEQATTALVLEMKRATLEGLQAANLGGMVAQYLGSLGDIAKATGAQADAALADIVKMESLTAALKKLPFDGLRDASLATFNSIAKITGGIDALGTKLSSYYSNFYSDAEKSTKVLGDISAAVIAAGGNSRLPTDRAGYRAMVEEAARHLDTTAGVNLYGTLINLADAFASVVPAAQGVSAAVAQLQTNVDNARSALVSAYNTESSALKTAITAQQDYTKSILAFRNTLLLGASSTLTPEQKYQQALSNYNRTELLAAGGDAQGQKDYQAAAQSLLDNSKVINASSDNYTADFNRVMQDSQMVADKSAAQANISQLQLDSLTIQVKLLTSIDTSVLGVQQAILNLSSALQAANEPIPSSLNTGVINSAYGSALDRAPRGAEIAAQINSLRNGQNFAGLLSDISGSANGSHANGLTQVPFDGYKAILHKNEQVLTSSQATDYRSFGGANTVALVQEIKLLRAEVASAKEQAAEHANALITTNIQATMQAADSVVKSSDKAANKMVWAKTSKADII